MTPQTEIQNDILIRAFYEAAQYKKEPVDALRDLGFKIDPVGDDKTFCIVEILKIVASYYNMEVSALLEKTRKVDVVTKRQIAMFFCVEYKEMLGVTLRDIGKQCGERDHATVKHSHKAILGYETVKCKIYWIHIRNLRNIILKKLINM